MLHRSRCTELPLPALGQVLNYLLIIIIHQEVYLICRVSSLQSKSRWSCHSSVITSFLVGLIVGERGQQNINVFSFLEQIIKK